MNGQSEHPEQALFSQVFKLS